MIELHNLRPPEGSRRNRKRVGRGPGSGTGKTAGRGENGQNSRSGGGVPPWFEGGQMPLQRRIPKRGFTNRNRVEYQVVNVGDLNLLDGEATPASLKAAGLIRSLRRPVKILGTGEVASPLRCSVHGASASARRKIEAAGGSVTVLPLGSGGGE
jgi:large subunit ribosomal protein L15